MRSLAKNFAMAAGAGLGLSAAFLYFDARRQPARAEEALPHDLDARLESMEQRLAGLDAEKSEGSSEHPERNSQELDALRVELDELSVTAQKLIQDSAVRLQELRTGLQAEIEAEIGPRLAEALQRISAETKAQMDQFRARLGKAAIAEVGARLGSLEAAICGQGSSIAMLRERAQQTDLNLQRLVGAIERLCAQPAGQEGKPAPRNLPGPVAPKAFPEQFRAAAVSDRPRLPMSRIV